MGYVKAQIPATQDLPPPPPRHTSSAMRPRPHRSPRPSRGGHQSVWLYGRHPVLAALANPDRKLERLLATREMAERHAADFGAAGLLAKPEILPREDLAQRLPAGAVHQGIAALVAPLEEAQLED